MKKSITKNYIYNVSYQILTLILPLITTPYVSRVLGAENLGIYGFTLSIATYFILFGTLGISMYAQREIAYVQDDKHKRSKLFWEIFIFRFITMLISICVYYFLYINGSQYKIYYVVLTIEMIAVIFDISWLFQGLEDFKKTVTRNLIIKIISIISIFTFVKDEKDIINYFIIYVASNLIGNMSLWLYLPKYINKIKVRELQILKHLRPTISLFIPQIAIQIYTLLDKTMLGIFIEDKKEVGYYDQAQKIIRMLLTVVTSLGAVMLPRIANTFANGDRKLINEYTKRSFNFVYFLSIPMVFGMILVAKDFVPLFFGQGYEKVAILISIISPVLILIGLSNVTGMQYLLPTKRQKEFSLSVIIGAIVNFIINIIFIMKYQSIGASISTVIAEAIVTIAQLYFLRKDIDIKEIIILSKKYIFASIIMFSISYICGIFIDNSLIKMALQLIVGMLTYVTILFILKDKFLNYLIEKIKKTILKK